MTTSPQTDTLIQLNWNFGLYYIGKKKRERKKTHRVNVFDVCIDFLVRWDWNFTMCVLYYHLHTACVCVSCHVKREQIKKKEEKNVASEWMNIEQQQQQHSCVRIVDGVCAYTS